MRDFAITEDGKYSITNFNLGLVSDEDYIIQKIRIKLKTFLGEYYLNTSLGIPYRTAQEKNPNLSLLIAAMKEKIIEVSGVEKILEFAARFDPAIRKFFVRFTVQLDNKAVVRGEV